MWKIPLSAAMNLENLYTLYLQSKSVSTDTRKIKPGDLFFALKGPNFNANTFAEKALEEGAAYAVIDDENYKKDERYIVVKDVLQTLQDLARHHRRQLNIPVFGITGSNGKTTTKELVREVLSTTYRTYATQGNLNNHIGVPLTLLSLTEDIEVAIIEMGANKIGDIQELAGIAEPTHGLITNIGLAHTEGFGGLDGVIRGKSELYLYLINHKGTVFINSQNELLHNMGKRFDRPYYYPQKGDYYHCRFVSAAPFVQLDTEEGETVNTQLIGAYNFENIAAALCIGKYFKVPAGKANQAVSNYIPSNNRSQIVRKGTNTVIMDAYNANPNSMEAAVNNLKAMAGKRKALILGDMYELGSQSEAAHVRLGEVVAEGDFEKVIFCGKHIQAALATNPQALYFEDKDALITYLSAHPFQDTIILVKASRGIGLEKTADFIQ